MMWTNKGRANPRTNKLQVRVFETLQAFFSWLSSLINKQRRLSANLSIAHESLPQLAQTNARLLGLSTSTRLLGLTTSAPLLVAPNQHPTFSSSSSQGRSFPLTTTDFLLWCVYSTSSYSTSTTRAAFALLPPPPHWLQNKTTNPVTHLFELWITVLPSRIFLHWL